MVNRGHLGEKVPTGNQDHRGTSATSSVVHEEPQALKGLWVILDHKDRQGRMELMVS